jgi:hypothetical protein
LPGRAGGSAWALPAILAVTALVYAPSLVNGFTNWDDDRYVLQNPAITSLAGPYLAAHFTRFLEGNYHPLTMISLSVDYAVGGLDPFVYHLTNLLLHLLNTVLAYGLVRLLIDSPAAAAACALLFGMHPLHVESVAWVAERKDVLYALFFLSSLISYVRYVKTQRMSYYWWALALFIGSLLSKAMAVSLSLTLFALDHFLSRRLTSRRVLQEKVPFLLLSLAFGLVAMAAQASQGAVVPEGYFAFHERLLIASRGLVQYVVKLFVPFDQTAFYAYPPMTDGALPAVYWLFPILVLLGTGAIAVLARRSRVVLFGCLFFLLNIGLVLQVFPVGSAMMAERYVYVSSLGLFLMIGDAYSRLLATRYGSMATLLLAGYAVFLGASTYRYVQVWQDDLTLWDAVIARQPHSGLPYYNRGTTLLAMKQYSRALGDLSKAVEISPGYAEAHHNRGAAKKELKDYRGAVVDFRQTIALNPGYRDAYINLGNTLMLLGDHRDAEAAFSGAIALGGSAAIVGDLHIKRGIARYRAGQRDAACADWRRADELGIPAAQEMLREYCR